MSDAAPTPARPRPEGLAGATTLDVQAATDPAPDILPNDVTPGVRGVEDALQRQAVFNKLFGHDEVTRIGRYRVLNKLGEGGMGVVFAAVDEDLDRKIALKVLRTGGGSALEKRLQREARAMAKLSHPNVVTVHEVAVHGEQLCIAMEFVEGGTLRDWLRQEHSFAEICDKFAQTARGVEAAHEVGIVHRDLKPDNVLVGIDGRVRVLDFGLAKASDELELGIGQTPDPDPDSTSPENLERLTVTGAVMGTPRYMAPEQFLAEPCDARTDQFSFCVALYEALFSCRPFPGTSMRAISTAVVDGTPQTPPPDSKVPRDLGDAIMAGLSRDPEHRHASLLPLVELLEGYAAGPVVAAERDPPKRRPWLAIVALLSVGVGAIAVLRSQSQTLPTPAAAQAVAAPTEEPRAATEVRPPTQVPRGDRTVVEAPSTPPPTPSPNPESVLLAIEGAPPNAEVFAGKTRLGRADEPITVPYGKAEITVEVRAKGHRNAVVRFVPEQDTTQTVSMPTRRRKVSRPKALADSPPADPPTPTPTSKETDLEAIGR